MTKKKKTTAPVDKFADAVQPIKESALQKALNVINSYKAAIYKHKKKDYDLKNIKGFNDPDDALFFRNLQNRWGNPYTESDILDKKLNFGEGSIVFNDGQKYAVKKENDHFIIAN